MRKRRRHYVIVYILLWGLMLPVSGLKGSDTLLLSRNMSEARFLQENLLLIAERLNIEKAEALLLQERFWPNPTLNIDEVNLWATQSQLGYFGEELPPLWGEVGRNRQLSVELEQLIYTAGKRRKRIAVERVATEISRQEFEEVLRELKLEFRNTLTSLQFLQQQHTLYNQQRDNINRLISSFERQHREGHLGMGELVRLQALSLEFSRAQFDIATGIHEAQRALQSLLNLPPGVVPVLTTDDFLPDTTRLENLQAAMLLEVASQNRPDLKMQSLFEEYYRRQYDLARAHRIPDVTLKGSYDRGGNFMLNFIGAGIAIDLPVFDRNRGNILHAGHGIRQSEVLLQHKRSEVNHEVMEAYRNLLLALQFFRGIAPDYEETLHQLMESYTGGLIRRDISMLEYIDFLHAYTENITIIHEGIKELQERTEALQYVMGTDLQ